MAALRRIEAVIYNQVMVQDIERIVRPFREKKEVGDEDWRTEYWASGQPRGTGLLL